MITLGDQRVRPTPQNEWAIIFDVTQVSNKIFVDEKSACERGSSFGEMNRSASSNDKKGPTKKYNAFKNFHESETSAHVIAAWMNFAGMNATEGITKCICQFCFIHLHPSLGQFIWFNHFKPAEVKEESERKETKEDDVQAFGVTAHFLHMNPAMKTPIQTNKTCLVEHSLTKHGVTKHV